MLNMIQQAEAGEHNILLPAIPELVWSAIIIAIFFFVILKYVYPKYKEITDQRATTIKEGLEKAEQAKQDIAAFAPQRQDLLFTADYYAMRAEKY